MIADDRESQIVDRRNFCDRLRSYGNPLLRSFAILRSWSQTIAEDRTMFYLLRSPAIVYDRLRSFAILRSYGNQSSAICDRNVTHDNLFQTQMIQRFVAKKPECPFMFVTVLSETRRSLSSVWKAPSFCHFINIFRTQNRCFLRFWSWRYRRFRTKRRSKFACSKISSSMSAMLFAKVLPRAQRACTFDISADRSVWLQPALRSFAIVCDYMETALFAIVCDRLRLYGNQP